MIKILLTHASGSANCPLTNSPLSITNEKDWLENFTLT